MIEIWMIFALFYPFSVVTLYCLLQFLREHNQDIPVPMKVEKAAWKNKNLKLIIRFLLDFGLPVIFLFFIIIFWILGILKTTSTVVNNSC